MFKREEVAIKLKVEEKNVHVSLDYTYIKLKCGKYILSFVFQQYWYQNQRSKQKKITVLPVFPTQLQLQPH